MRRFLQIALLIGLAVLVWGIWRQDYEEMGFALFSIAALFGWEYARERRLTGAKLLKRFRPSATMVRVAAWALAAFAVATGLGLLGGIIPSDLVVAMLAFVIAAPILAAPFLFFHRQARINAEAAKAWPTVIGRVEQANMYDVGDWPFPIVIYSYEIDGRKYRSSRVRFGGTGAMNPEAAEQVVASYAAGSDVPVFYNPRRPRQSVLLNGEMGTNRSLLWGAGCVAAGPLLGAIGLGIFVLLGLIDAALTAVVGHRVLP